MEIYYFVYLFLKKDKSPVLLVVVIARPARFEAVCSSVTLENLVALLCVVISPFVTVLVGSDVGNVIFVGLLIVHPSAHGKCVYVMYSELIKENSAYPATY